MKTHISYPGRVERGNPTDTCQLDSVYRLHCYGQSSDIQACKNNALYFRLLLQSYLKHHHSSGCGSSCSKVLWAHKHTYTKPINKCCISPDKRYKWNISIVKIVGDQHQHGNLYSKHPQTQKCWWGCGATGTLIMAGGDAGWRSHFGGHFGNFLQN